MADAGSLPLVKGTVDLLVLKALSWGPMHGFGISTWLQEESAGALEIDDSAMYQVLHRLESRDLIEAEWGVTENNRKARYYRLTPAGRKHLRAEIETWLKASSSVTSILTLSPRPSAGS
jgi:transcriptional regulator